MSLFDFFFPQQAAASHLRAMREQQLDAMQQQRQVARSRAADEEALASRVEAMERDMGFLTLMVASLLDVLNDRGIITRDDVKNQLEQLDVADGMRDGQFSIRDLKKML